MILYKSAPILTTFSTLGNITSVLNNRFKIDGWLYNHFIQLSAGNLYKFTYQKRMYLDCPFLESHSIPDYLIGNIIEFIESSIENNFYLFFLVDRYYLENYKEYHKEHVVHEIFVYGYDKSNQIFYTSDNSINYKYQNMKISYFSLQSAYLAVMQHKMKLSCVVSCVPPVIDIHKIKHLIFDYINSNRDFNDFGYKASTVYGIEIYQKYVEELCCEKLVNDFRPVNLFLEHKKLMQNRIQFLMANGYLPHNDFLLSEYNDIVRKFLLFKNLQIRFVISNRNVKLDNYVSDFLNTVNKESKILKKIFL